MNEIIITNDILYTPLVFNGTSTSKPFVRLVAMSDDILQYQWDYKHMKNANIKKWIVSKFLTLCAVLCLKV